MTELMQEISNTNNITAKNKNPVIQIKELNPEITKQWETPHYATSGSAAMDLRACLKSPITLEPKQCELIPTGYAMYLQDPSLCAMILPRSGLGHKHGIVLGNSVGLIDSDYQGELMISCWNRSDKAYTINSGDRIAQLLILAHKNIEFQKVNDFEKSDRGAGGFGHTGNK